MIPPDTSLSRDVLAAYETCRQITKGSAKTFYWGSLFLPHHKRLATWALYAFLRSVDDIVDEPGVAADPATALAIWRQRIVKVYEGVASDPVTIAWSDLLRTYDVPLQPALDLIEGMHMDLNRVRPETFDDLYLYCYRVAGTVGLLMSPILGYRSREALPCAVDLGVAMQLTNILRDIGEDARIGRCYLPRKDLEQFGYTEADLVAGVINAPFIALMQFQIQRAHDYYERACPGIDLLDPGAQLAIRASAEIYRGILDAIVENHYDVFTKRAYVPTSAKILAMPRLWLNMKLGRSSHEIRNPLPFSTEGIPI